MVDSPTHLPSARSGHRMVKLGTTTTQVEGDCVTTTLALPLNKVLLPFKGFMLP